MTEDQKKMFTLAPGHNRVRANAIQAIQDAPDGYVVTIQAPKRSLIQNAKLHVLLNRLAAVYPWQGKQISMETWKILFTASLKGQEIIPGLDGHYVAVGHHTSQMSVREVSDLIELVHAFCAQRGIDLGLPVEDIECVGRCA